MIYLSTCDDDTVTSYRRQAWLMHLKGRVTATISLLIDQISKAETLDWREWRRELVLVAGQSVEEQVHLTVRIVD